MKRLILIAGAILAIVVLLPAAVVYAQVECVEETSEQGCGEDEHKAPVSEEGNRYFPHSECKRCLSGSGCHPPGCSPTLPDPEDTAAYEAMIAAAVVGDLDSVVRNGRHVSAYVLFNESRRSIQIIGCSDIIVANLPVPADRPTLVVDLRAMLTATEQLGLNER